MNCLKKQISWIFVLIVLLLAALAWIGGQPFLEDYLVMRKSLDQADAIVVMAGQRDQRLPTAARLYHKGVAPRMLLTNDNVFAG